MLFGMGQKIEENLDKESKKAAKCNTFLSKNLRFVQKVTNFLTHPRYNNYLAEFNVCVVMEILSAGKIIFIKYVGLLYLSFRSYKEVNLHIDLEIYTKG